MVKSLLPKPVASVKYINFGTVAVGSKQSAVIVVKNCGGDYRNLKVKPEPWFIITEVRHLSSKNELTLKMETNCQEDGVIYNGFLIISMDKKEAKVRVRVRTKKKRKPKPPQPAPQPEPVKKENPLKPVKSAVISCLYAIASVLSKAFSALKRIKWKKAGKWFGGTAAAGLLTAAVFLIALSIPPGAEKPIQDEETIKPLLGNLDAWIEAVIVPSMTEAPDEWHEHWYNDYALDGNVLWVIGGVTVTQKSNSFKSVNFVFYSPNKGETWEAKWNTERVEAVRFFGTKRLEFGKDKEVFVLLEGAFASRWMLFTSDEGKTWQIRSQWEPGKA